MIKSSKYFILITALLVLSGCDNSDNNDTSATLNPPGNLIGQWAASSGDQFIKLSWEGAEGATAYNIYWSTTSGSGTNGTLISDVSSPYNHTGLTNGTEYFYVIAATNSSGEGPPRNEVSATPVAADPNSILLSSLTFPDANLNSCVNNHPKVYVHETFFIRCEDKNITNLTGIDSLTNVLTVHLSDNPITSYTGLSGLASPHTLYLNNTNIEDINATGIAALSNLERLFLEDNNIKDVSPLASLTGLTHLYLSSNDIGNGVTGNVDSLAALSNANLIQLVANLNMSCIELSTLITTLGSPPVDLDNNIVDFDQASAGVYCTAP